jgi:omega-amidase
MKTKIHTIQASRMDYSSSIDFLSRLDVDPDEILVFPEKFITQIIDKKKMEKIISALKINNIIIFGSITYTDQYLFNRSYIIMNRKISGYQDKINLFKNESIKYTSGPELKLYTINGIRIGILICYDLDFPSLSRLLFKNRCDVIFNPSLIQSKFHREWHLYVKARALENRIPVISVNSISDNYNGDSIIASPYIDGDGVRLEVLVSQKEDMIYTIDTDKYAMARDARIHEEENNNKIPGIKIF